MVVPLDVCAGLAVVDDSGAGVPDDSAYVSDRLFGELISEPFFESSQPVLLNGLQVRSNVCSCICTPRFSRFQGNRDGIIAVDCACLWGRVPAVGSRCGSPIDDSHQRAPHSGLGSLCQSPYRLVGSEWALADVNALISVVPEGRGSFLSDKGSPLAHDPVVHCLDGCLGSFCRTCGTYILGGCAHALARLGPIHSIVGCTTGTRSSVLICFVACKYLSRTVRVQSG